MTPRFRPRAVVFDLDGTLVDSLPLVLAAIGHAIAPYGRRPEKDIFASLGGPPALFLGALLPDLAHLPTALDRMEQYHRENAHLIQPFAGATRILGALQAQVQLALWTGRDRVSTEWILNEHRLESFFATAVCGDDLATHKPDPEGLRAILQRLGVQPADTLFVGDADVDVAGGAASGVKTLLIRNGRQVEPQISAQAWMVVDSPREALELTLACLA